MQVIYRASDGVEFTNERECQYHEANNPLFKMWNSEGRTENIEDAEVVHICDWDGRDNFIALCDKDGITHDGIENPGIYVWDDCEWREADNFPFGAIRQYLNDVN